MIGSVPAGLIEFPSTESAPIEFALNGFALIDFGSAGPDESGLIQSPLSVLTDSGPSLVQSALVQLQPSLSRLSESFI